MAITIGGILLADDDLSPQSATLGGQLVDQVVEMSDGSGFLAISGTRNNDLVLQGTFQNTDASGTPYQKIAALEALRDTWQPTAITGLPTISSATLRKVDWAPVRASAVDYTLTFYRERQGGAAALSSATPPAAVVAQSTASGVSNFYTSSASAALAASITGLQATLGTK